MIGHGAGRPTASSTSCRSIVEAADIEHPPAGVLPCTRREPRVIPPDQKRRGPRSSYIGSASCRWSILSQAPYAADLRQLSIQALCTVATVLHMPTGLAQSDASPSIAAPVTSVRTISGRAAHSAVADRAIAWRAISHLSLNDPSSVNASRQQAAGALRDLLELYATTTDVSARRQIEGISRSTCGRRAAAADAGPIAFGRGLEITVDVDEMAFEGGSVFLLGAVLERYFARYVSLNSVTETVLRSQSRGEINRWTPNWGTRPTL